MIFLGLLILVAAVIIGVGIVTMSANTDATHTFVLFGYGFETTLAGMFLMGACVGALALLGLAMVLGRASGIAHQRRATKHELRETRREAKLARKERDELLEEQRRRDDELLSAQRRHDDDRTVAPDAAYEPTRRDARQEPVVEYETISSPPGSTTSNRVVDDAGTTSDRLTPRRQHSGFWSKLRGHRAESVNRP
jgi:uncharacterized membrane protein